MSASQQQCAQARVFLTLYKQAVQTLKQSAANNVDWTHYFGFRDKFINVKQKVSGQKLKLIMQSPNLPLKQKFLDIDTLKNVQYMRFNYYAFLKHLPNYLQFQGSSRELIALMQSGNESFKKQLENAKNIKNYPQ